MKASCIIPTFGRAASEVIRTIESLLNLKEEFVDYCADVFIVDQNSPPLKLDTWAKGIKEHDIDYIVHNVNSGRNKKNYKSKNIRIVHIVGLNPSLPIAKNYAARMSEQEYLFIFDDDVVVNPGCIKLHIQTLKDTKDIGALAGREIVGPEQFKRSAFRETTVSFFEKLLLTSKSEDRYKLNGKYVGRVKPNSFMFCRFDLSGKGLVEVDTVRGCYWSIKREVFNKADGFDQNFQGALRDETDLCLRVKNLGYKNYFLCDAYVYHKRQLGGCNNVATSYSSLLVKFENEFYFQFKHFLPRSSFYYFVRLLPMVFESFKRTWGMSLILHLQYTWNLFKIKTKKSNRDAFESSLKHPVP
ncbi:MAG: glycosyltransferase family 2 protein [Candidatus Anammoxibacter sp.]